MPACGGPAPVHAIQDPGVPALRLSSRTPPRLLKSANAEMRPSSSTCCQHLERCISTNHGLLREQQQQPLVAPPAHRQPIIYTTITSLIQQQMPWLRVPALELWRSTVLRARTLEGPWPIHERCYVATERASPAITAACTCEASTPHATLRRFECWLCSGCRLSQPT
jgi:hypothetical protein